MTTRSDVLALRGELARVAQVAYDEWEQNDDGEDVEHGCGGICHVIADRMQALLDERLGGMPTSSEYVEADCHVVIVAQAGDGVLRIDLPAGVYEGGAGYVWRKKPGVTIGADDVDVFVLDRDPDRDGDYVSEPDRSPAP